MKFVFQHSFISKFSPIFFRSNFFSTVFTHFTKINSLLLSQNKVSSYSFFVNNDSYKYFFLNFVKAKKFYKFAYSYLHLKGIGFKLYRATSPSAVVVNSGYNHYTKFLLPKFSTVFVRKAYIIFSSLFFKHKYYINYLRSIRFPDPYRAKGFRFKNQIIKFKVGKQRLQNAKAFSEKLVFEFFVWTYI